MVLKRKRNKRESSTLASAAEPFLTDAEIVEFKSLYSEHCAVELTDKEAFDKGVRFLKMFEAVLKATARKTDLANKQE